MARILDASQGNPFFALELARALRMAMLSPTGASRFCTRLAPTPDQPEAGRHRPGRRGRAARRRGAAPAQEHVVCPARQAVPLPDHASFELGAAWGSQR